MNNPLARWVTALASSLAPFVSALAGSADSTPAAASALLQFRSAFADYKPWQDIKPGTWRALNDALQRGETGGTGAMHDMGSMHDMPTMHGHSPSPIPAASAPASAPDSEAAHSGHHTHGGNP
jgi:hypothetical protein